jgi:hypothetical protein
VKKLDSSPLFVNSTPDLMGRSNTGTGETFQIHTSRRAGR